MGWLNDLLTFLSDADGTSIHLLIGNVEQMLHSLKRSTADCFPFFNKKDTILVESAKGNPCQVQRQTDQIQEYVWSKSLTFWEI